MKVSRLASAIEPTLIRTITARAKPTSLHLGLGQPDWPLSSAAAKPLHEIKAAPYTPNRGLPRLVDAIWERYSGDPGIIVTCGVQEALALAFLGLVEGGDVLVPDPGFPAYPNLARASGARPVPYRLGDDWGLDPVLVEAAWTDETVAIVLNSPSNPTGAVSSAEATKAVVELCKARGAFWISDEIYEDFVWKGEHHSPREFDANGIVVSGLSKSHAAMGLRIGWLVGPRDVVDPLVPLHQHLVTCAPTVSQVAAIEMLAEHQDQVRRIRRVFERRRQIALDGVLAIPDVGPVRSDGAFYLFADVRRHLREGETTVDLAMEILESVDVVTIPGAGFGAAGEGWLRLAYTVDEAMLTEAFGRLRDFFLHRRSA